MIRKIVLDVIKKDKTNKITGHESGGKFFNIVLLERDGGTVIPMRFIRKGFEVPTLFVFKTNKKGIVYGWHGLLEFEILSKKTIYDSNEIIIDDSVLTPIEDFNEEQAKAIVGDVYYKLHDRYLDIYSVSDTVVAVYRDKFTGKRCRKTIRGYNWYFYIKKKDYNKMIEVLGETQHDRMITDTEGDGEYLRVYCKNFSKSDYDKDKMGDPAYIIKTNLKGRVDTFEADVSLAGRYMIDEHIKVDTNLRILYYDIETDDSTTKIDMDINAILSIGAVDNDGNEFFKASSDESELIRWWATLSKGYDLIVGYNSYNFDAPYIQLRGKLHKVWWGPNFKPWRCGHIDMMRRIIGSYGRFGEISSFSLENVSQHFLGKGKVKHEEKIIELFNHNRAKLKKYNLMDCHLLKELDEELGVTRLMIAMCGWTGCFPSIFGPTKNTSGISVSRMLDIFIMRMAKDKNVHYKTVYWGDDTSGDRFEGAYVMEPEPGIYKDVHIFDFKSLYPTIIWSWNISPENVRKDRRTKEDLIESANDIYFYKDREAIFPSLVEQLMNARKEYRKLMSQHKAGSNEYKKFDVMQQVAKELTNSLYGALGQRGSRYFDIDVAGSVTAAGRFLIKATKEMLDNDGMRVIYGDTDSVFVTKSTVNPNELCIMVTDRLKDIIRDKFNIDSSIIELEYEKKFNKLISIAMKNYAGVREDGSIDIKGLDCVKKSTIAYTKREQRNVIEDLLRRECHAGYYMDMFRGLKDKFYSTTPNVDDIVQRTSISKHPNDLKTLQPHARVALQLIEEQREFYVGMQIPYVITDKKGKGVVHVDDYNGIFDKDYYWDRIYTPIKRILDVCFPEQDWGIFSHKGTKAKRVAKKAKTTKAVAPITLKKGGRFVIKRKLSRFVIKNDGNNQLGDL